MISITNCQFCGEKLTTKYFRDKEYYVCTKHKPSTVSYRPSSFINGKLIDEKWIITYSDYRLSYFDDKSFLHKMNRDSNSVKDFLSLITVFDYELNIRPEDFSKKLPTLLTFS